jgi:hypothetical protein
VGRDTRTQLIALALMVFFLGASGVLAVGLTNSGGRNRLSYTDTPVEGQPPQVAAGIAMGAFRGLFVNMLWYRANQLKEDGRYHESMDLARAITELQPRFPQVWVFHAWNMAYNISVSTQTPEERWRWVNSGIHLLRDEGIPANPNDLLIHKELAWIFLHKVGGYMDDANLFYKKQLAAEWTMVLGPPPKPDPGDRDAAVSTKKYADWFRPVAEAPDDPREVLRREPSTAALVQHLRADANIEPNQDFVQIYAQAQAISLSPTRPLFEQQMNPTERTLIAMIADPQYAKAWAALMPYLRRKLLIEQYHMEPERMLRYTEEFGPLDWRHYGAHALYWGNRGVENALLRYTAENKRDFDFVNSGRIVIQSLQELWRSGDVYFDFLSYIRARGDVRLQASVYYRGAPHVHFIDSYGKHLDEYVKIAWSEWQKDQNGQSQRTRAYTLYSAGYENFVKDAIRFLYRRGEKARAAKMKDDLAVWPYHNRNDPDRLSLFSMSLDEFVKKELEDELTRPSVAREEVVGALEGAFVNGLLAGDDPLFHDQLEYAKMVHTYFMRQQVKGNAVDVNGSRMEFMDRDFRIVAGSEFASLITRVDLEDSEALYDKAPDTLRVFAYDILSETYKGFLDKLAEGGGHRTFTQTFPQPEGLEEFRAEVKARREQKLNRPNVEQK